MASIYGAYTELPLSFSIPLTLALVGLVAIAQNVIRQLYFPNPHRPPVVFHIFPFIGSTIQYGIDPFKFFFDCRAKYGDCFTFILVGRPVTAFLGPKGNELILNGKHSDLNAEDIYAKLTTPCFGKGVIYDCSNERFMDQKRLVKEGFRTEAMNVFVPKMVKEVEDYVRTSPRLSGQSGVCNVTEMMAEITIYTATSSLQGNEVRSKFDTSFATLYRHLDDGFQPINFIAPWLPLPRNRRRNKAQKIMEELYSNIIKSRRSNPEGPVNGEQDMMWNLMDAQYKDGTTIPDAHIARLMIALLMGGQHNSAAVGAWIILNLANKPHLIEELYQEQLAVLGSSPLTWKNLSQLTLNEYVIKETLRLHDPIHSILRKVTTPRPVPGTDWVVPETHTLLASPIILARSEEFFPQPMVWNPHRWGTAETLAKAGLGEKDDDMPKVNYGFGMVSKSVTSPYLPFSAGRHRCIGEQYAYAQLGAVIATMVRLLQWEQVDPKAPIPSTDYSSMFSRPMNPTTIRWRRRH
ncbi:cytochrome P450 [Thozetella sp. PMI_491]|nr:cytochrome P450 [Thozetella sp. PMI_491]